MNIPLFQRVSLMCHPFESLLCGFFIYISVSFNSVWQKLCNKVFTLCQSLWWWMCVASQPFFTLNEHTHTHTYGCKVTKFQTCRRHWIWRFWAKISVFTFFFLCYYLFKELPSCVATFSAYNTKILYSLVN